MKELYTKPNTSALEVRRNLVPAAAAAAAAAATAIVAGTRKTKGMHENAKSASLQANYTHSSESNKESTDAESHAEVQNHMRGNLLCGLFFAGR